LSAILFQINKPSGNSIRRSKIIKQGLYGTFGHITALCVNLLACMTVVDSRNAKRPMEIKIVINTLMIDALCLHLHMPSKKYFRIKI
jgi:hypothetical protein